MNPLVTIITPTYNKPTYFAQCAESVLAQTFQDWVWWVVVNTWTFPLAYEQHLPLFNDSRITPIWFPVDEMIRHTRHVPAAIVNWLYPKVTTPYIYFLADDDLIDPDGLNVLVDAALNLPVFEKQPRTKALDAVYGRCDVYNEQPDGSFKFAAWCGEGYDIGLNCQTQPDCFIDSSQILHTKALWDRATADGWRLTTDINEEVAGHADGILLNRLAEFATFHYVPQRIVSHRRTRLSTWHKPQI